MVSAVGHGAAAPKTCTSTAKQAQKLATAAPDSSSKLFLLYGTNICKRFFFNLLNKLQGTKEL